MPYLAVLKNPSKNRGSGSIGGTLRKCNHFFGVHRYICGKNFVTLLTDKQTNAGHYITLAEVINEHRKRTKLWL